MITRKRQAAAKTESTPGTKETLSAADAKVLFYNPKVQITPETYERDPERMSSDQLSAIVGKRPGRFTGEFDLAGSGTATTDPEWIKFLKACGFVSNALYSITIGAITSGPFQHGETVTGGTSGATARVVMKTADGTTTLYYVPISGTLQDAETITGGTSGASATTGSDPSEVGKEVALRPLGEEDPITCSDLNWVTGTDAFVKELAGAVGKATLNFQTGEPVKVALDMMGVFAGVSDGSIFSPTYPTVKPPAFLGATFTIDGYAAQFASLAVNIENDIQEDTDEKATYGIKRYNIVNRKVTGSIDIKAVPVATHDAYGKLLGGSEMEMKWSFAPTAGNKFVFYAPRVQYREIDEGDRNGQVTFENNLSFNGGENALNEAFVMLLL